MVPQVSSLLLNWFTWYTRQYLRRHFHSIRASVVGTPVDPSGLPLVVFSNHASWWDPLVGLLLKDTFFRSRTLFVPIDEAMLQRYRFFRRLGFFGVEQGTRRGAEQFLRTSRAVLEHLNPVLAVTPQGRFADVRERPIRLKAGLGHLATQVERACFLPIAIEYVFWNERLPEVLVRFGEPIVVEQGDRSERSARDWSEVMERRLEATLDALSEEALRREPSHFRSLLSGGAGQGGVYDVWRFCRGRFARGRK